MRPVVDDELKRIELLLKIDKEPARSKQKQSSQSSASEIPATTATPIESKEALKIKTDAEMKSSASPSRKVPSPTNKGPSKLLKKRN
jgi:hypothetical protein